MKLKKNIINESLERVKKIFNENIYPIDNEIGINYIDDNEFLVVARADKITSIFISIGLYTNFNRDYSSFALIQPSDKMPLLKSLGKPFTITFSLDRAKKLLKNEQPKVVQKYLDYVLLSQLVIIYQEKLIEKYSEAYNILLKDSFNEDIVKDEFNSIFASKYCDEDIASKIDFKLNNSVYSKMKKLTNDDLSLKSKLEEEKTSKAFKYI